MSRLCYVDTLRFCEVGKGNCGVLADAVQAPQSKQQQFNMTFTANNKWLAESTKQTSDQNDPSVVRGFYSG